MANLFDLRGALTAIAAVAAVLLPASAQGQAHEQAAGQAAFEAIADIVSRLEADPSTDWSRVDVEALRLHLIDMDRVFMETQVEMEAVDGGARFRVTGEGDVVGSIQRMATAHARVLERSGEYGASTGMTEDGALVTVTAADGSSSGATKIRGLGFAGLLTLDDHHAPHHWMLASGVRPPGH